MDVSIVAFVLLLALAFANGANDVSKAIATLVGSGVTGYRTAILWGTAWTVLGAVLSGVIATAMVKTFSQGLLAPGVSASPNLVVAVLVGAMLWVLVASRTGLPVSTTHALTGAIVGAGLLAFGREGLLWEDWKENCSAAHSEPSLGVGALSRAASTHAKAGGSLGRNLPVCDADGSGAGYDRWTGGDADAFSNCDSGATGDGCSGSVRPGWTERAHGWTGQHPLVFERVSFLGARDE